MTKEKLLEYVNRGFPHSEQITDWDISLADQLRFTWRSQRFCVSLDSLTCETIEGNLAAVSDLAILAERAIKDQMIFDSFKSFKKD